MPGGKKQQLGAIVHSHGVTFRVWAPLAKHVAVAVPYLPYDTSNQIALERDDKGIWSADIAHAEVGQNYKYIITTNHDEVIERNDPRARILSSSSDGASVSVVSGNDFDWGDDIFMPIPKTEQVIYEMHIGTFHRPDPATMGTFADAIEKLDYLAELGVNMIELMPITSMSSGNGWGYDVHSIFSVENSYGGRHGLMTFVKECHSRGIGVIADVVYNHFANPEIWQFDGWTDEHPAGMYFWGDERNQTPWGSRVDYSRKEVRRFILDSVAMWMNEYRLDGLRLDSTSYLRNLDGTDNASRDIESAWKLLQEITALVHRLRPGSIVIAEDTGSNEWLTKSTTDGGAGCDAQWRLNFPEALYQALGIDARYPADIKQELTHSYNGDPFARVLFSDSHDTASNGRANEIIAPHRGEDTHAQQELLLANTVVLTAPGIPMLLQGQEFVQDGAFNDWNDLDWEHTDIHSSIVDAHRDLINLRRNSDAASGGLTSHNISLFHVNDKDRVFGYHRWHEGGPGDDVIVILNFGDTTFPEYIVELPVAGSWRVAFCSEQYIDEAWSPLPFEMKSQTTCLVSLPARGSILLTRIKDIA